jgi:hypothetical protein
MKKKLEAIPCKALILIFQLIFVVLCFSETYAENATGFKTFNEKSICITFSYPESFSSVKAVERFTLKKEGIDATWISVCPNLYVDMFKDGDIMQNITNQNAPSRRPDISKCRMLSEKKMNLSNRNAFIKTWTFMKKKADYTKTLILIDSKKEKIYNGYLCVSVTTSGVESAEHKKLIGLILKTIKFR